MTEREIVCLQCPLGCRMKVRLDAQGDVVSVEGNTCPKGEAYAHKEVKNPVRVLTTTVGLKTKDTEHPMLPVQTAGPIPKHLLLEAMKVVQTVCVSAPIAYGQVIIPNILDTGVDVVSTTAVEE